MNEGKSLGFAFVVLLYFVAASLWQALRFTRSRKPSGN